MEKSVETTPKNRHSTVEFILRRMRRSRDFPAISKNITAINRKLSAKEKNFSASEIANLVLKDYALTTRLLKQVNSAFYATGRKPVTTVSRAVVLLGFEQVRIAATSLMLFEHLRGSAHTEALKESVVISFMSGLFARKFAENLNIDIEEAFICAMLHNLGRHLVMLHLQKEYDEIKRTMVRKEVDEQAASKTVLGRSFHELGMEILAEWNFSDKIIKSIQPLSDGQLNKPQSTSDVLRGISNFANELCHLIQNTQDHERDRAFAVITKRFEKIVPVSSKQLQELLNATLPEVKRLSEILNITNSSFVRKLTHEPEIQDPEQRSEEDQAPVADRKTGSDDAMTEPQLEKTVPPAAAPYSDELETVITNGIQEISHTLVEDFRLNDLITMIIEIMYRGFTFDRAIFCMAAPKNRWMQARFGLGKDIERLIGAFRFSVSNASDVFNSAVTRNLDFRIDDSSAAAISSRIPEWYRRTVNAPSFIIYPIFIEKMCLGFLYGDREDAGDPILERQLNYMKTLRNQLLLGIKQKRLGK